MSTPSGLNHFQRSMVSKRADKCHFCATPTTPGVDYAALNNGKWIAVCALHATSTVEQAKALLLLIDSEASAANLSDADKVTIQALIPAELGNVLVGSADEHTAVAVVTALGNVRQAVQVFKPVDPIVGKLQTVLAGTTATAWERDFASSLLDQVNRGRLLSEKQLAIAERITTAPAAKAPRAELALGLYTEADGTIWWVRTGRNSGNKYAMRLLSDPDAPGKPDWDFIRGGLAILARSGAVLDTTGEVAARLGHASHFCCFCSIALTDDGDNRSVKVGYGPICAKRYSLPWG